MQNHRGRLVACFNEDGTIHMEIDIPRDRAARVKMAADLCRIADDITRVDRYPMTPWQEVQ